MPYQEIGSSLSDCVNDIHRALESLGEELEAVGRYNKRASTCIDQELKAILIYNCDGEKEHSAMHLEWLRQSDTKFDEELKTKLFSKNDIVSK